MMSFNMIAETSFDCKECSESFSSLKSLHAHIKKHNLMMGDYYVKHFQRKNKLTGSLLEFKNYDQYFESDFSNRNQMIEWCDTAPSQQVEEYLIYCLKNRIETKQLSCAPSTIELYTAGLPTMDLYKKVFGKYGKACNLCDVKPMFGDVMPHEFNNEYGNHKIFIDTREQQPLHFKISELLKLDVGDYAVSGDEYSYTYVDRKSFGDFCGTMTSFAARFVRELQRCREMGCYLFIVTEVDLYKMEAINKRSPKKYNLNYVFHSMRDIQREFKDCCQFVFSGNRSNSEKIIPKLLCVGKKLWNVDVQYFLDINNKE